VFVELRSFRIGLAHDDDGIDLAFAEHVELDGRTHGAAKPFHDRLIVELPNRRAVDPYDDVVGSDSREVSAAARRDLDNAEAATFRVSELGVNSARGLSSTSAAAACKQSAPQYERGNRSTMSAHRVGPA